MLSHRKFSKAILFASALAMVLCLCAGVLALAEETGTSEETNVTNGQDITLTPGQTYDVSTAKDNTAVHISQAGTYYLKGSSTKCRVLIESGGVDVYLKDGLNIHPGPKANTGGTAAAITVYDQGGTVRLISEKNAKINLTGYLSSPAIHKKGTTSKPKTKLVFETVDINNPGTITAKVDTLNFSAGIGSGRGEDIHVGNMEFKSGIIYATGGNGAGIGGGNGVCTVEKLYFTGAEVHAEGTGFGAGIGGGLRSRCASVTITDGNIYAKGDRGAGIGNGGGDSVKFVSGGEIIITGGYIEASSVFGAGIGGGYYGEMRLIEISGGTIYAKTEYGACIGTGAYNLHGGARKDIIISGGTITCEGSDSHQTIGIGSYTCKDCYISISGGFIKSYAQYWSIGGGDNCHVYLNISGGTILCSHSKGINDIGSQGRFTCTITGGSLAAFINGYPTNAEGTPVWMMNVDLKNCPQMTRVTDATMIGAPADYGMNDVYTVDGDTDYSVVYAWLPLGSITTEMVANGIHYYGNVVTGKAEGYLYPATKITLDKNAAKSETYAENGSAAAGQGQTAALDVIQAKRPGYTIKGYAADASGNTLVMNTDGTLKPNCSGLTDSEGKWLPQAGTATLYAIWEGNPFTVQFSANRPDSASTEIEGTMANQSFTSGKAQSLTANGFSLLGYTFTGWNTKADGSGVALADGADGSSLRTMQESGDTVTLYAQWKPITYTVKFDNSPFAAMADQTMTFDQPARLIGATSPTAGGFVFVCWERTDGTGVITHFKDKQLVENLAYTQDAVVKLTSHWLTTPTDLVVSVTLNNKPVSGCVFTLVNEGGTAFNVPFTRTVKGLYVFKNSSGTLPEDTYTVWINDQNTGCTVTYPATETTCFAYYTVETVSGEHVGSVSVQPADSGNALYFGDDIGYTEGSRFLLTAKNMDVGYTFKQWQSPGVDPTYAEGKTEKDNPTVISLTGNTKMLATAQGIGYGVRFDANIPASASTSLTGQMEDQLLTFGEAQTLSPCAYTLTGYTFAGWNTMPSGTGTAFSDSAEVKNLTASEGGTVVLYAQWEPITYTVRFNGNDGEGTMADVTMTFDTPASLPRNLFTMTDWHFAGWAFGRVTGIAEFTDEQEVVNLTTVQDGTVTLFAQWNHDIYNVRYEANDGSGLCYEDEAWTHISYTVINSPFTRDGYTFAGWTTVPNSSSDIYYPSDDFIDPVEAGETFTLYARWKKGIPQTGDENTPLLWAGLMLTAGAGLVTVRLTRKRKRKHEHTQTLI